MQGEKAIKWQTFWLLCNCDCERVFGEQENVREMKFSVMIYDGERQRMYMAMIIMLCLT